MESTKRKYNLGELYGNETALRRYIRLTVGEGASLDKLIMNELVLGLCGGLPGALGLGLRNLVYPAIFRGISRNAHIGHHVTLRCARQIVLKSGVIIDDFVQLIANSTTQTAIHLGENSFARSFAMINAGPPHGFVYIGHNSSIGQGTILYGHGGLTIGNNVMIAAHCGIIASSHNFDNPDIPMSEQGYNAQGIAIEDNVWIGMGARILDGVTIGSGAIIGANAVVNRSVPSGARFGGVPARPLSSRGQRD
jgi:acetyltransferase-like isoleucine patch superfamily enzyme